MRKGVNVLLLRMLHVTVSPIQSEVEEEKRKKE